MALSDAAHEQARQDGAAPALPPRIKISEAVDKNWFEVWYEPKIDLKRKCLAGAQALACIRHPDRGMLMPGDFICGSATDLAKLSETALTAALESWSSFEDVGFNLGLAVNIPAPVLLELPIRELVAQRRPASGHWPGIVLLITEDEIVRDAKLAHEIASKLRVGGIKLAIDCFGAGYSSLSTLRDLPFVEIKLDRGFVHDCATEPTHAAICQIVIDLAHRFGSTATAQGIENQADLQALMAMGCDFAQGDLVSPPMSQVDLLELLCQRVSKPRSQFEPADVPATAAIINKVA